MASSPRIIIALAALILIGCKTQPSNPLTLNLTLAKSQIQIGEYPWYRLSVTNIGRKPIKLGSFLCSQRPYGPPIAGAPESPDNWFDIQITDEQGQNIFPNDRRHPHYWSNECGDESACLCQDKDSTIRISPLTGGKTVVATPSVVAALPTSRHEPMDGRLDPRRLPWSTPFLDPAARAQLARKWKIEVERSGYLLGDPTFVSTATTSGSPYAGYPKALFPGHRIFDDIGIDKPGRYRMRVVYQPFGYDTTYEQVITRLEDAGTTLERTHGWPAETRTFYYASNWVDFEVTAPAFPEQLLSSVPSDSPCEKLRKDWLRRALRDSQAWAGESPSKKTYTHTETELPKECRSGNPDLRKKEKLK